MGLFRLLFWIILIAAAIWLWRRLTNKPTSTGKPQQTTVTKALRAADAWYCSQAHLDQGSASGGH